MSVSNVDDVASKLVASLQTGTMSSRLHISLQMDTASLRLLELASVGPLAQTCAKPWVRLELPSYDVGSKVRFLPMPEALLLLPVLLVWTPALVVWTACHNLRSRCLLSLGTWT